MASHVLGRRNTGHHSCEWVNLNPDSTPTGIIGGGGDGSTERSQPPL